MWEYFIKISIWDAFEWNIADGSIWPRGNLNKNVLRYVLYPAITINCNNMCSDSEAPNQRSVSLSSARNER